MSKDNVKKFVNNLFFFTAPAMVVLFTLMAQGVPFEKAYPVALLALYGVIADFFKKYNEGSKEGTK